MQTMPSFVYLIPALIFFGLGNVPGMIATVVFAMPPAIRLTNLGIRQIPKELTEVADAFGSTGWQKLTKVELPVALPTIMAGINQCIMLSLSMVVIAAMIGARGLGYQVLFGIQRVDIGLGFEAGLSIVIIAVVLDRITQQLSPR
jgi:glycine betaine/proline transport system permease protein